MNKTKGEVFPFRSITACGHSSAVHSLKHSHTLLCLCRLIAVDHHNNDIFLVALAQMHSDPSESAAQLWLQTTHTSIQALLPHRPVLGHRDTADMGSTSSLADSTQTHQHMDTASSDAAMSDSDWSHKDQRGSFGSLDSFLTDHSTPITASSKHQQADAAADAHQYCSTNKGSTQPAHAPSQHQQADTGSISKQIQPPPFKLARSKQQYLKDVAACQQALHDGDSYEICLTTALVRPHPVDALHLYRTLRKVNPAPYAAFMSFGADELQVCCSSPERFLKGGRGGLLEARPIKGTAPRSADAEQDRAAALALANSEKDQAENLMIVDLLRNDLGRVCEVGHVYQMSCSVQYNEPLVCIPSGIPLLPLVEVLLYVKASLLLCHSGMALRKEGSTGISK